MKEFNKHINHGGEVIFVTNAKNDREEIREIESEGRKRKKEKRISTMLKKK